MASSSNSESLDASASKSVGFNLGFDFTSVQCSFRYTENVCRQERAVLDVPRRSRRDLGVPVCLSPRCPQNLSVVTRTIRAPLRSNSAFVATVEPWTISNCSASALLCRAQDFIYTLYHCVCRILGGRKDFVRKQVFINTHHNVRESATRINTYNF